MSAWYTGNGDGVPRAVLELARMRDGWDPKSWRDYLLTKAERCAQVNPQRSAELRAAAELMVVAARPAETPGQA